MQDQFLTQAQMTYPDLPLRADGVMVIVGGGDVDGGVLQRLHAEGAMVIGADGGADICASHGVTPQAIIGDMDSLADPDDWQGKSRLIALNEQHTTDFEKCLYATAAPVTVALGMIGKRLDHTLAALDAAGRYAKSRRIIFVDVADVALVTAAPVAFDVGAGERVSVHPLAEVRFARSEGLAFPLDGLTLAPGIATGTSNHTVDGPFSIEPVQDETSPWLLILDRKHLEMVIQSSASCRA